MDKNRIKEVLSDGAFVQDISQLKTVEEIQAAFREKDLYFSIEELNKFSEQFASGEELSFDQLDEVAGGGITVVIAYGINVIGALKKLFG